MTSLSAIPTTIKSQCVDAQQFCETIGCVLVQQRVLLTIGDYRTSTFVLLTYTNPSSVILGAIIQRSALLTDDALHLTECNNQWQLMLFLDLLGLRKDNWHD